MSWPTDRSQFLAGFLCPWKRLLQFHAFGKGIEKNALYAPLATGISIHKGLELILKGKATTQQQAADLLREPLAQYIKEHLDTQFENPQEEIAQQVAIVDALVHAYTRITIPWLHENFDLVDVEQGQAIELPGDQKILWRSRPDFVTRAKLGGGLAIHDFKSSSYWSDSDADQWADSLQQMLNAYVASQNYGERVESYYIHILVKGSKRSPSYLTHPSYRPANLPIQTEDILPFYCAKKGYSRVFAPNIPISIADWVWNAPGEHVAKTVPVVGPFPVNYNKVERFLSGLPRNEQSWQERLAGLDWENWKSPAFQQKLDERFPRTFNCYEFGGRRCQFYTICHHGPSWADPIGSKEFRVREPHHLIGEEE